MTDSYSEIEAVPIEWMELEQEGQFIPYGTVTLLAGEGGCGKGIVAIDVVAQVSRKLGNVILITPEDDLQGTVAYRLRAARANLDRVHDFTYDDDGNLFNLSMLVKLRREIESIGDVHLIVIDPLLAVSGKGMVGRETMEAIQRVAEETGCAILVTHHTVKSGAIAGSKGLTDACRLVYVIRPNPENPALMILTSETPFGGKSNISEKLKRNFTLEGRGPDMKVKWLSGHDMRKMRQREIGRRGPVWSGRKAK